MKYADAFAYADFSPESTDVAHPLADPFGLASRGFPPSFALRCIPPRSIRSNMRIGQQPSRARHKSGTPRLGKHGISRVILKGADNTGTLAKSFWRNPRVNGQSIIAIGLAHGAGVVAGRISPK